MALPRAASTADDTSRINRMVAHAHSELDSAYAWAQLTVSVVFATIGGAGMWAVVVVLPAVQAEFAVDRGDASLPYTATMIGFALGNVVVGAASTGSASWRPASFAALGDAASGFLLAAIDQFVRLVHARAGI